MTPTVLAAAGIAAACIVAVIWRDRGIAPATLLLLSWSLILMGFAAISAERGSPARTWLVYATLLAFTAGLLVRRRRVTDRPPGPRPPIGARTARGCNAALLGVGAFTLIHFARGGIPALRQTAEVSRFDLGSSGLLGLPSRCALFGLPILCLVFAAMPGHVPVRTRRAAWALLVLSRLAMGFKGGLIEVALILVTALLLRGRVPVVRVVRTGVAISVAALAYGVWIGNQYSTIARQGGVSGEYVFHRLSIGAAEAGWYGLAMCGRFTGEPSVLVHDLRYFGERYFGVPGGPSFAWDQILSSVMTGTPRRGDSFLVPVTTGGPTYLICSAAPWLVLATAVGLGLLWRRCEQYFAGSPTLPVAMAVAGALLGLRVFILNGAGAYVLINYTFSVLLVLAFFCLGHLSVLGGTGPGGRDVSGDISGIGGRRAASLSS